MPIRHCVPWLMAACMAAFLLAGCAHRVDALLPADAILLGEQHDAPEHQQAHRRVVEQLSDRDLLAALVLEMADVGTSTRHLGADATAPQVREALRWNDEAWPWTAYGPAILAAVRAGVPVLGANLPRSGFAAVMQDVRLDASLPPAALAALQTSIRAGHCDLLPPAQIAPMTRIQIARDQSMARTVQAAARPGQVVVLLAGSGHVDRQVGVPRHLPPQLRVRAVRLLAGGPAAPLPGFDSVWPTPAVPRADHCTDLQLRLKR